VNQKKVPKVLMESQEEDLNKEKDENEENMEDEEEKKESEESERNQEGSEEVEEMRDEGDDEDEPEQQESNNIPNATNLLADKIQKVTPNTTIHTLRHIIRPIFDVCCFQILNIKI
jgi:TATA-binding protein-associated factor Taf7